MMNLSLFDTRSVSDLGHRENFAKPRDYVGEIRCELKLRLSLKAGYLQRVLNVSKERSRGPIDFMWRVRRHEAMIQPCHFSCRKSSSEDCEASGSDFGDMHREGG